MDCMCEHIFLSSVIWCVEETWYDWHWENYPPEFKWRGWKQLKPTIPPSTIKIIYVFSAVLPTLHASDIGETGRILCKAFLTALFVWYGIKQDTRTLDKLKVACAQNETNCFYVLWFQSFFPWFVYVSYT